MIRFSFFVVACLLIVSSAFAQTTVTISNPPPSATASSNILITETVWNNGISSTGGVMQNLSLVPAAGGAGLPLGTRGVPSLQGGGISTATTSVTIPPNVPAGTYVLGAGNAGCAGNCLKSSGTVTIVASPGYTLAVQLNTSGAGLGFIAINNASNGAPIAMCPPNCSPAIPSGTSVKISGAPSAGGVFQGWAAGSNTGCAQGMAPCTFTMNAAKAITATLSPAGQTVNVTVFVSGPGQVSGGLEANIQQNHPSFYNCNAPAPFGCVTSGNAGSAFILSELPGTIPASGPFTSSHPAVFKGWSGAGCTGSAQGSYAIRIVANTSITCTATFQ